MIKVTVRRVFRRLCDGIAHTIANESMIRLLHMPCQCVLLMAEPIAVDVPARALWYWPALLPQGTGPKHCLGTTASAAQKRIHLLCDRQERSSIRQEPFWVRHVSCRGHDTVGVASRVFRRQSCLVTTVSTPYNRGPDRQYMSGHSPWTERIGLDTSKHGAEGIDEEKEATSVKPLPGAILVPIGKVRRDPNQP